jgi:hypothetical protein
MPACPRAAVERLEVIVCGQDEELPRRRRALAEEKPDPVEAGDVDDRLTLDLDETDECRHAEEEDER